ncbi:MAG: methyl-accepting chemotaxis protein [Gammaproteobacteria bacterium]|nr:methyl-accepting chemotaxis protein [Gammaproteobacteria bacterium]
MFRNLTIGKRLSAGFILILLAIIAAIIPVVISQTSKIVHQAELRELEKVFNNAQAEIQSKGQLAQALSLTIAQTPEVQQDFANGDRQSLAERTVPLFKLLKQEYAVRQFQFHTPPAISFLRAHKPEKFGDDLSSFRKTVVKTNETRKPISGLEEGVAGLGIRGMVPVFNDGNHIGSIELGMSFGQPFFEQFKKQYSVDISLYIKRDGNFKVFGSTLNDQKLLSTEELNYALASNIVNVQLVNNDKPYAIYARSINDFSGNPVGVLEIAMDRSDYVASISETRNITAIICAIALIIGILFVLLFSVGITRPINRAVAAMNDIAEGEGDLTKRLDESGNDEITMLSCAFNRFAEKVRNIIGQVADSTLQLSNATEKMDHISQTTMHGVRQQQQETEQVATAMNEMTATVQEVARHASDAASSASCANDETESGKQIVEKTAHEINALAEDIEKSAHVINELESESENIGGVLDVIKGIAEQTNLLALNAAIEAARAGEQGRGFAVVADEVRTLASRTQASTREIQEMIERLQANSQHAVEVMQRSKDGAMTCVNKATDAGNSLNTITQSVNRISDMNMQIASAAEEQSGVAEEINRNISNINEVVHQTAESTSEVSHASKELAALSSTLEALVAQFKT